MFYFLFYYIYYFTLVPLFILLIYPFYKVYIFDYGKFLIDSLKIKNTITIENQSTGSIMEINVDDRQHFIKKGFVIANHRSFTDFVIDPYIARCAYVCRGLAFLIVLFMNIFFYLEVGSVTINRTRDTRKSIFAKMLKYERVLFFPEGTRLRYFYLNSPEDVKKYLRYGILKEIYYHRNLPVQLQISSNKEYVIDEKRMKINKGIYVRTHISGPIYPDKYQTEQEFYDSIAQKWYHSWKIVNSELQCF